MKHFVLAGFLSIGLLTTRLLQGQGTVLVQHSGATDPTSEGFAGGQSGLGSVGPVTGDLGMDAWATTGRAIGYTQTLLPQQQLQLVNADWALSLTLRVVQSGGSAGNSFVLFYTGNEDFILFFGSQADGDPFVLMGGSSLSPMYVLEQGGSGYHNYQYVYSAASGRADLWVDGMERVSNIPGESRGTGQPGLISWGQDQSLAPQSQANWNLVSLEIIPEPSSVTLLCCGGVLFAARLLRRSKH